VGASHALLRRRPVGAVYCLISGRLRARISTRSTFTNVLAPPWEPTYYIGFTLYYYHRRIRAEGFDLLVLGRELPEATDPRP
jgi:hypothetical protein